MARATVQAPVTRGGNSGSFWDPFNSPRNQRRILIFSSLVFLAGLIAFTAFVWMRGTGNAFQSPISNTPAKLVQKEYKVAPSQAALRIARQFVESAPLRVNLDKIYPYIHENLKGNMTRKQWDTGNIPV